MRENKENFSIFKDLLIIISKLSLGLITLCTACIILICDLLIADIRTFGIKILLIGISILYVIIVIITYKKDIYTINNKSIKNKIIILGFVFQIILAILTFFVCWMNVPMSWF